MYIKTKISDNLEIKVRIYEDEIYQSCSVCGKEMQVSSGDIEFMLKHEMDFGSTSVTCGDCFEKEKLARME